MSKHLGLRVTFAMLATVVLLVACCPPIRSTTKKLISDNSQYSQNDGSSIEVFANSYAYTDPGGASWCATGDLDISPQDLSGLPPCPLTKCLAAVNVTPDDIKFPSSENATTKPILRYDLDEHKPAIEPETCGKSSKCYAFYQLRPSISTWRFVGYAKAVPVGVEWFAEGRISHFSIFALVELPAPTPVTGPRITGMVVASDFIEDDLGDISVGVTVLEDDLGEFGQEGEQRLLQFSGVDPGSFEGEVPRDCTALPSVAEQFTCLFPIDTVVEFELNENGRAMLRAPELGYGVEFFVSDVQIY